MNDPTSFLNDPDLSERYGLVIVFLLSSFHFTEKIRTILYAVFKNLDFESSTKSHFELILLNDPQLQKFTKIQHFNKFSCGFRQKFTKSPNFHNFDDLSRYLLPLFVKIQKTSFFTTFSRFLNDPEFSGKIRLCQFSSFMVP